MTEAALDEPDEQELVDAVSAAARRAIDPAQEVDAGVRSVGHRAIELLRLEEATDEVAALLVGGTGQDPSHWARGAAASALGALGGPKALEALRRALIHDPSQDVRAAAARELGDLEDESGPTTERLIDALRDEAGVVRLNARRALRQIHGADLGLDPRTWRGWILARGVRSSAQEPEEPSPQVGEDDAPYGEPPMDLGPAEPPPDGRPVDEEPVDDEAPLIEPRRGSDEGDEPR